MCNAWGTKANGCYDGFMNRLYTDLSTFPVDRCAVKPYRHRDRILALTADAAGRDLPNDVGGCAEIMVALTPQPMVSPDHHALTTSSSPQSQHVRAASVQSSAMMIRQTAVSA